MTAEDAPDDAAALAMAGDGRQTPAQRLEVVLFESRRAREMASLVERFGGVAIAAPTLREVPRTGEDAAAARAFVAALAQGAFDGVVFMTGIGARALAAEARDGAPAIDLAAALGRATVFARGPKPVVALRELGARADVAVPAPNTHVEVAAALGAAGLLRAGAHVAVVEHGAPSLALYATLEAAGVALCRVPVYRWSLVEDTAPLVAALERLAAGSARAALFTSAAQIDLAMGVAAERGLDAAVLATLRAGVVGSIGPVCSARLRAEGLEPDVEPAQGKMGLLVKAFAERARDVLRAKAAIV